MTHRLESAALAAIKRWRIEPALKKCVPVSSTSLVPIGFAHAESQVGTRMLEVGSATERQPLAIALRFRRSTTAKV